MTSLRQIESNRRNALRSTGPKTETGKLRSSKNAVRHGLTAETVIEPLEDPEDYKAFELAITADYDAETVVERELVLRLASLLWRLRRSTSIETGLLQIQSEVLREHRTRPTQTPSREGTLVAAFRIGRSANELRSLDACSGDYCINSEICGYRRNEVGTAGARTSVRYRSVLPAPLQSRQQHLRTAWTL